MGHLQSVHPFIPGKKLKPAAAERTARGRSAAIDRSLRQPATRGEGVHRSNVNRTNIVLSMNRGEMKW
jgi:hypothetical protein